MSEQPIRDAATLIIVDETDNTPRILMGRRRPDLVFLPNTFVFPGGRVDPDDATTPSASDLADGELKLLQANIHGPGNTPEQARAFALTAIREAFEETGIVIGSPAPETRPSHPAAWASFLDHGYLPSLEGLNFILRAITPPGRPRRFDTRFFMVNARAIAHRSPACDDELSEIGWFTIEDMLSKDVPRMTHIALQEIARIFRDGLREPHTRVVPFHFEHNNVRQQAELSLAASRP